MIEPAVQPKPMTFEEAALLDPDECPGEISGGLWAPVEQRSWRHGEVAVPGSRRREVWIVDSEEELVMVLTAPNGIRIIGAGDTLDGGDVLPGFSCNVSEFFE